MARVSLNNLVVLHPTTGAYVSGASVRIQNRPGGSTATVFTTETGNTAATQPLTTSAQGRIAGWVNRGRYQAVISVPSFPDTTEYIDAATAEDGSVTASWISDGAVTTAKMATDSVDSTIIGPGAVDATALGTDAVTTPKIAAQAVGNGEIQDDAIDATKLRDDSTTDANRAVTTNHLRDSAVTSAKIQDNAVITSKIPDGAVTSAKLAVGLAGIPSGVMLEFAGASAPSGYLMCDGAAVSRSTYAALYAALGGGSSPHGQGDGTTTFNVPDCRGRTTIHPDGSAGRVTTNNALGNSAGAATHSLTTGELASHAHTHTFTVAAGGDHNHSGNTGSTTPAVTGGSGTLNTNIIGDHQHNGLTGLTDIGNHTHRFGSTLISNTQQGGGGTGARLTGHNATDGVAYADLSADEAGITSYAHTPVGGDQHSHNHSISLDGSHAHTIASHTHTSSAHLHSIGASGTHTHTLSGAIDTTGSGTGHNNLQPYLVINKIIKT